jgi:hypothetical protein
MNFQGHEVIWRRVDHGQKPLMGSPNAIANASSFYLSNAKSMWKERKGETVQKCRSLYLLVYQKCWKEA